MGKVMGLDGKTPPKPEIKIDAAKLKILYVKNAKERYLDKFLCLKDYQH